MTLRGALSEIKRFVVDMEKRCGTKAEEYKNESVKISRRSAPTSGVLCRKRGVLLAFVL